MTYSRKKDIVPFGYSINGSFLQAVSHIKDLGVIFDSFLRFDIHINSIINHAYKMLGFIIRNSRFFKSIDSISTLYFSFVRNKLEYCSLVWDPFSVNSITSLEIVQNKFLRYLYFKRFNAPCNRDLSTVVLRSLFYFEPLSTRRSKLAILFLFKLLHNLVDSSELLSKINFHVPRSNLRPSVILSVPFCYTVQHYNLSIFKACRLVNLHRDEIDLFNNNFSLFLNQLDRFITY